MKRLARFSRLKQKLGAKQEDQVYPNHGTFLVHNDHLQQPSRISNVQRQSFETEYGSLHKENEFSQPESQIIRLQPLVVDFQPEIQTTGIEPLVIDFHPTTVDLKPPPLPERPKSVSGVLSETNHLVFESAVAPQHPLPPQPPPLPNRPISVPDAFGNTEFLAFESEFAPHIELVEIQIGDGIKSKTFHSVVDVLSSHSARMNDFFNSCPTFNVLIFPNWEPLIYELFEQFTLSSPQPVQYQPCQYYTEAHWDESALHACFLAIELDAQHFLRYALSIFIQNCALESYETWEEIEEKLAEGNPLRRFSDHWIAWNSYLAGDITHEYIGLIAEPLVRLVTDETSDPRIMDLEHWFSECGDSFNSKCDHDPVELERRHQAEQKEELKRLKGEEKLSEEDEEAIIYEVQANSRLTNGDPT
jgi:hypothetical protein